jgi:signal transduction histidine kinase/ligand-binding sensor domain-containing protein
MAIVKKVRSVRLRRLTPLYALCLLLSPLTALPAPTDPAAAYTVRRWTLDDGLPDSQVCGVVPGQDGYLWLATVRHLVRFDSLRFTTVEMPPQSDVGRNEGIFQDSRGGLWLYGFLGAVRYKDGTWWQSEAAGMPRGRVTSVAESPDGIVYLAQERVIYAWKADVARPILKPSAFTNETGSFRQLAWNRDGGLWIAMGDGLLYCWSPDKAAPPARMTDIRAEWVLLSAADRPLVAHGSFVCLRRKSGLWERLPDTRPVSARCLLDMPDGALWVGHDAGVNVFSENAWHAQPQRALDGASRVLGIATDRERNIWMATTDGLVRMRHRVMQKVPVQGRPAGTGISSLWVESGGHVWASLRSGGLATGDAEGLVPLPAPPDFADIAINALYCEDNGTLWCGGSGENLWTLKKDVPQRSEGAYADDVRAILGRGGAPLWIATRRGVFAFNGSLNMLEEMAWPLDPVLALWQDTNGSLWAGHESLGLAVLRSGGRDEFLSERDLPGRTIRALYRDNEGVLWIGGLTGLARWEDGRRFVFRRAHGLWNESVRQIAEDASGGLWLGTAGGIMRIAKQELADVAAGRKELLTVRTFGVEAGMERVECTGGVFFPAGEPPRDRLWFPTRAEPVTVETRNLLPARPAPEVRLTGVELGGLVTLRTGTRAVKTAHLANGSNLHDVRLDYTALDFSTPERVRFRHELTGPVTQRSGLTEERQITFSRLPPGDYAFRVTACNGDGVWSRDGAVVAWTVRPFFWETAGFRLGCLLLGCVCVVFAVRTVERRRVRRKLEAAERQEGLERERARIARDIHDDLGVSLTQIALQCEVMQDDLDQPERMRRHVTELSQSSRAVTRSVDEIIWAVTPGNDTLETFTGFIGQFVENTLKPTGMACRLALPTELPNLPMMATVRHCLYLVLREALNNVIRHAGAKTVRFTLALTDRHLTLTLADDGCGFDPGRQSALAKERLCRGNGLSNMRKRMAEIGGTVDLVSVPGQGTTLTAQVNL